jgi:predicted nucleic acid-binding protein
MRLVDSSAWVEFLRRKGDPAVKEVVARLLETDQAAFTCPVRFELMSGVRPAETADLAQALALSHHLPFEAVDWTAAAELERSFRATGLTVPRNDLFVATVAIRTGIPVVCRDIHFNAMRKAAGARLKVEQV